MTYYPPGYTVIGAVPLPKAVVPPSVSTRKRVVAKDGTVTFESLKVGEWLEKKQRLCAGDYGARKYRQAQVKLRREAKMTEAMKASRVAARRRETEKRSASRRGFFSQFFTRREKR